MAGKVELGTVNTRFEYGPELPQIPAVEDVGKRIALDQGQIGLGTVYVLLPFCAIEQSGRSPVGYLDRLSVSLSDPSNPQRNAFCKESEIRGVEINRNQWFGDRPFSTAYATQVTP